MYILLPLAVSWYPRTYESVPSPWWQTPSLPHSCLYFFLERVIIITTPNIPDGPHLLIWIASPPLPHCTHTEWPRRYDPFSLSLLDHQSSGLKIRAKRHRPAGHWSSCPVQYSSLHPVHMSVHPCHRHSVHSAHVRAGCRNLWWQDRNCSEYVFLPLRF